MNFPSNLNCDGEIVSEMGPRSILLGKSCDCPSNSETTKNSDAIMDPATIMI